MSRYDDDLMPDFMGLLDDAENWEYRTSFTPIESAKAAAKEAMRLYRQCRKPKKEAEYFDRLMKCRASLLDACDGNTIRFRSEWEESIS